MRTASSVYFEWKKPIKTASEGEGRLIASQGVWHLEQLTEFGPKVQKVLWETQ